MQPLTAFLLAVFVCCLLGGAPLAQAATDGMNAMEAFDEANKLYEQGKLGAASDAYETLIRLGHGTPAAWFNLGNARFRNGEPGRAISALLNAQRLSPSDESIRRNLEHMRKAVQGETHAGPGLWRGLLHRFTVNEWALIAGSAVAAFFLLLTVAEWKTRSRASLRLPMRLAAVLALTGFIASWKRHSEESHRVAVVIIKEASVRFTPLDESPVSFTAPDGLELLVMAEKKSASGDVEWLEIMDPARRMGWIKGSQVHQVLGGM